MVLSQWETNALVTLWQASDGNLTVKEQIEAELKKRAAKNEAFAKEDLFLVNIVRKHVLTLNFIPGTESYLQYGPSITINLKLSEEEILLLQANLSNKPPKRTFGSMPAKPGITGQLNKEQADLLGTAGFNTGDIYEILHL